MGRAERRMKRIVWLTDIHLNFVEPSRVDSFLERVRATGADAVLLGGDVAEAHDAVSYLEQMDEALALPIYFVLGNHDFYFGSIERVRRDVAALCAMRQNLVYLTQSDAIKLADGVAVVGHDGWADGRIGDYERSLVMMNDYKLIEELAGVGKQQRWPLLKALGDEAADYIRRVLPPALENHRHVYLLTHVPPLREACWHEGKISDDQWAPHFACQAMGEAILDIMGHYNDRRLTVLCGHTHGQGTTRPLENVVIHTSGAVYGEPEIAAVLELE